MRRRSNTGVHLHEIRGALVVSRDFVVGVEASWGKGREEGIKGGRRVTSKTKHKRILMLILKRFLPFKVCDYWSYMLEGQTYILVLAWASRLLLLAYLTL